MRRASDPLDAEDGLSLARAWKVSSGARPPLKPWRPRRASRADSMGVYFSSAISLCAFREVSIELEVAEPTLKTDRKVPVAVTDLRRVIRGQHLREAVVKRRIA